MKIFSALISILLLVYGCLMLIPPKPVKNVSFYDDTDGLVIAHRAGRGLMPGNTLAAAKNAISMGSSTQIAVFIAPLMVIIAWALGVPLTFEFGTLETVSAFLAVLIVNSIAADGKSNWLEGAMLLSSYGVLAAAFLFHP